VSIQCFLLFRLKQAQSQQLELVQELNEVKSRLIELENATSYDAETVRRTQQQLAIMTKVQFSFHSKLWPGSGNSPQC
jgi:hypothetical protein